MIANGGSAAFRNFLKSIDRSKVHVIKVHLGHPSNYVKPTFNHGELNPLRWAYENPKRQRIMDDSRLSDAEVEAAYAKETELLNWLVGDFFKDNPGSRFISAHELAGMVQTATGTTVSLETIRAANKDMLEQWREIGTYLPNYARVGTQYFSLSDMFYLLANTVGGMNASGRMPESVNLKFVYGPTETPDMVNTAIQSVSRGDIEKTAAVLARQLHDDTWKELPANRVPAKIRCRDVDMNAAEFLRLMSEAMVATDETAKIPVRRFWMFSSAGEGFPRSRNKNEEGGMWTNKPAPLKLTSQAR